MTRPDAGDLPPASSPLARTWTLIGPDGKPCKSLVPGTLGGHRRGRLYGGLEGSALAREWSCRECGPGVQQNRTAGLRRVQPPWSTA